MTEGREAVEQSEPSASEAEAEAEEPVDDHLAEEPVDDHLAGVPAGAGCTEIWDHLSEERRDGDDG